MTLTYVVAYKIGDWKLARCLKNCSCQSGTSGVRNEHP